MVDDTPEDKKNLVIDEHELINYEIVTNEFPKSGELYYYLYKNKYFHMACVIHYSLFIKSKIPLLKDNVNIKFLWHANHNWDNNLDECKLILKLKNFNDVLIKYVRKNEWNVCFGIMSVIRYNHIKDLQEKYDIFNLLNNIKNRNDRMCIERIFACLTTNNISECESYFGFSDSINDVFAPWGYTYKQYISNNKDYKVVKVWTGR